MSDQTPVAAQKLQANQSLIAGRIDSLRTYEVNGKRTFETRIVQAAPDAFSSPTSVAVQSFNRIGSVGDDVKVHVSCVGYKDSYKTKDGEIVQTARNVLRAVE
jgi:hypothetical protein